MARNKTYFTIGNIIGETVNLYANNFLKFWLPYILVSVPISLLLEVLKTNFRDGFYSMSLFTIVTYFVSAIITLYVSIVGIQVYRNKETGFSQSFNELSKIIILYMILQVLMFLGILGGIFLLIVPGVIFSLFWAVASIVIIVEKNEVRLSMKRSRFLTKGFKGEILISYMIIALAAFTVYFLFAMIASAGLGDQVGILDRISSMTVNPLSLSNMLYTIISSILTPLYPVLAVVMYHNLIKEKEGYETEELAESFLDNSKK